MKKKYNAKPGSVEAVQWTGQNKEEIIEFCGDNAVSFLNTPIPRKEDKDNYWKYDILSIETKNGSIQVSFDDYILKDSEGCFYVHNPDSFIQKYEETTK